MQGTYEGDTVADTLHEETGASESGRGDVLAAEVVDDRANDEVDGGEEGEGAGHGAGVLLGVAHLTENAKVHGRSRGREEDDVDGAHGLREGGAADDLERLVPVASGWGLGRAVLDTDGDGEDDDGGDDGGDTRPAYPGDLGEGTDRREEEAHDGRDDDEDGRARAVQRHGVERGRDADNGGGSAEHHDCC